MVYPGVDLHRKVSHLVPLDEAGEVLVSRRRSNGPAEFRRVFGELEPAPIEVAFEATYGWSWFADLLADVGVEAHMAHPLATRAIAAGRVKNDAVDAKTLAHLLRTHLLPESWIAPPEVRNVRRLVRMRDSLVRIRSRLKCQVLAICADLGVSVPASDLFGVGGRRLLDGVTLPPLSTGRLEADLRLIDALAVEIVFADKEIDRCFGGDDRIARLLPIPGIGVHIAAVIAAEVWDVRRFGSPERLTSWAGLTPTEHSSADHTRRGHLSKQGSRWLRWVMVVATVKAVRAPTLHAFAAPIEARRATKIARVALARRPLTLAFYALSDPAACRAYPLSLRTTRAFTARSPMGTASA
ncbi:MAG: IS110 family transposase [Candidatus Limnocylindrales bacterium]